MEKDRQTKIIAIVALFIGVATLTLGFATFSAKLIIQSKATVTPDADSFKVVLSKEETKETAGTVTPTGSGEAATINNTGDNPTISGLKANFVNPGEKVVYEFYAVNLGEYDAFLNKIDFRNITDQAVNKKCTKGENTTDAYVQSACNSIRVTVKVAEDDKACQTSTYGAHKLEKKTGEKVVVEIEYGTDGVRADGPFSVQFGDILLNYSTIDNEEKDVPECNDIIVAKACPRKLEGHDNIIDNDCNDILSLGDKVTLGTESFYVISTNDIDRTVTMFAEWNLNVGNKTVSGTPGMQNPQCRGLISVDEYHCLIAFSSTNYWSSTVSTYPAEVYSDKSYLHTHVEKYVEKLKEAGYSSVSGRLIKYEELESLRCSGGVCTDGPSWLRGTSFWTGTANDSVSIYFAIAGGGSGANRNNNPYNSGVRPVITINADEI